MGSLLFTIATKDYQHFQFTAADATLVRDIILALCIGIILAAVAMFYQRAVPGALVRALLAEQATSPKDAKTLAELGLDGKRLLAHELKNSSFLRRFVHTAEEAPRDPENKPLPESDRAEQGIAPETARSASTGENSAPRYYIPEELVVRAEDRFATKGNDVLSLILTCILSLGIGVLVMKILPLILGMIDAIL